MNKKALTIFALIAISLTIFAFNGFQPSSGKTSQITPSSPQGTKESPRPSDAPEHVIYRQFFHHLVTLKARANDVESKGGDGRGLRSYFKRKANLTENEAAVLDAVAADCEREVADLDAKAKLIIDAYRARLLHGKIDSKNLPPLPPQLATLQEQRNLAILHARERLQKSLGQQAFSRLDDFIKMNAERNSRPAQVTPAPGLNPQVGR
ncbi:MAG TPA: hypothetical protein VF088_18510 [Pyrinomonadaceae bacterium]